jgi:hypothetical protein
MPPPAAFAAPVLAEAAPASASRVPLLIGMIAAGVLLLGGGVTLAVVFLSGDSKKTKQAEKNKDADDGDDDGDRDGKRHKDVLVPDEGDSDSKDRDRHPESDDKPVVVKPKKPLTPEEIARNKKVNEAIDKGVNFLKDCLNGKQINIGFYRTTGAYALAGLTLLNCGVKADDPAVAKAIQTVRAQVGTLGTTYDMAACIWFLDKLKDPKDKPAIQALALSLVASQGVNGGWNYVSTRLTADQQTNLLSLLKKTPLESMPKDKVPGQFKPGGPGGGFVPDYTKLPVMQFKPGDKLGPNPKVGGYEDNSLTQFVILALWAAQEHGVPTGRSLAFAEARYRAAQKPNGSWAYSWSNFDNQRTDSMTCAGLLGLAVGRGIKKGDKKLGALVDDPAVKKGMEFLSNNIGKPWQKSPYGPTGKITGLQTWGDLYYLWSLERVGVVYDIQKVNGKDWYAWGADILVASQQADGRWQDDFAGMVDTSFALLFLKRVNVVKSLTSKLRKLEATK